MNFNAGSSPLARGLPRSVPGSSRPWRIIPARAGFTPRQPSLRPPHRDHPRSRGVYLHHMIPLSGLLGSSPLARGLQAGAHEEGCHGGIIPARAGFTGQARFSLLRGRDHPRSRGVYLVDALKRRLVAGSSPLARGLLTALPQSPLHSRIIPARAGFTPTGSSTRRRSRDHPRSRGVYGGRRIDVAVDLGSSPLARGLLFLRFSILRALRIIPARAGFTLGDRRDSNGGPPYQGAFAFTGDLGTARLSCGSVVAGQRSTTTPSPV